VDDPLAEVADVDELNLALGRRGREHLSAAGDEVEIGVRPAGIGTKSFELEYQVRSGAAVAAEAKTVIVSYDYETARSVELPQSWKEALAA